MITTLTVTIVGDEAAANLLARRIVNTLDNHAAWINTNHKGLITEVRAKHRIVTQSTNAETVLSLDGNGDIIKTL